MHGNQVIWFEENIGPKWETSRQCCVLRKVICKEVTAGGRFNFFLDSALASRNGYNHCVASRIQVIIFHLVRY